MKKIFSRLVSRLRCLAPAIVSVAVFNFNKSTAQLSLDQYNFPQQSIYKHAGALVTGVAIPPEGTNQFWDYSNLVEDPASSGNIVKHGFPVNDPPFPDASQWFRKDFYLAGGAIDIVSSVTEGVNASGYYQFAEKFKRQSFPLGAFTTVATDSFIVPKLKVPLYRLNVALPASYGSSWTSTGRIVDKYQLSFAFYGLDHAPGEYVVNYILTDSVKGWGKLIIPAGFGSPSVMEDVLMVKRNYYRIDSLYLDGAPAPIGILYAFGFVQGGIYPEYQYLFYRAGTTSEFLRITTDSSYSSVTQLSYDILNIIPDCDSYSVVMCRNGKMRCVPYYAVANRLIKGWNLGPCSPAPLREWETASVFNDATNVQSFTNTRIIPNPSADKFKLQIDTDSDLPITFTLYDVTGRRIVHLENTAKELMLGDDLIAGVYFVWINQGDQSEILKMVKW